MTRSTPASSALDCASSRTRPEAEAVAARRGRRRRGRRAAPRWRSVALADRRRGCARARPQALDQRAPQPRQLGERQDRFALELDDERLGAGREAEDRPAEPAELLLQRLGRERPVARGLQFHLRSDLDLVAEVVARRDRERSADGAAHAQRDRRAAPRLALFALRERRVEPRLELGIFGLEDARARLDPREVGPALPSEDEVDQVGRRRVPAVAPKRRGRRDLALRGAAVDAQVEDGAALLARLGIGPFEERRPSPRLTGAASATVATRARIDVGDPAEETPRFLGVAPLDQLLVVHAAEEAVREPAREALRRGRGPPRLRGPRAPSPARLVGARLR